MSVLLCFHGLGKQELADKTRSCPFLLSRVSFSPSRVWSCDCNRNRARIYFVKCEVNYAKQFCGPGCGTAAASHPLAVHGFSSIFISAVCPPFSPLNKQISTYHCLAVNQAEQTRQ